MTYSFCRNIRESLTITLPILLGAFVMAPVIVYTMWKENNY